MATICKYCKKEFEPTDRNHLAKYCSDECRKAHSKAYQKEYAKYRKVPVTPKKKHKPAPYCETPKKCIICGNKFFLKNGWQLCCSKECGEKRRRQVNRDRRERYKLGIDEPNSNNRRRHRLMQEVVEYEKKGIVYNELSADEKIYYGKTQTKAYADDFKVTIPQGLKSWKERQNEKTTL